MFSRFKTNSITLFIDSLLEEKIEYEKGTKLNIILSPSLYWVKKLSLPISNLREVKKLLPSIFEDNLPKSHYSYTAYKKEDDFILFAYEDKKIFELLKKLHINSSDVLGIYFAQSEFETMSGACEVNATQSIYLQNSLVVLAPTQWLTESKALVLENISLSKHKIKLQQFGHIVDRKSFYKIGIVLALLALVLIGEIFITKSKLNDIRESKEKLFSRYKLQSTMFQNRAGLKKYSKIHTIETKLREYISYFLSMKLSNKEKITSIEYKNGFLNVTISNLVKTSADRIKMQLDTKGVIYKIVSNRASMRVEMKI